MLQLVDHFISTLFINIFGSAVVTVALLLVSKVLNSEISNGNHESMSSNFGKTTTFLW